MFARAVVVGAVMCVSAACSSGGTSAPGQQSNVIGIQTSQLSVLVENKVGMPLTEVDVAIVPVGRATEFTKYIGRLETSEKRDLALGDFHGRDGTTLSLRVVRPNIVRVTAKDLTNKAYKVETPWR